jgi:hypothetical protein
VSELCKAITNLQASYKKDDNSLPAGLCATLCWDYDIDYIYDLIHAFYREETRMVGTPWSKVGEAYTKLGPYGIFTQERYDFLTMMLEHAQRGKYDTWISTWIFDNAGTQESV